MDTNKVTIANQRTKTVLWLSNWPVSIQKFPHYYVVTENKNKYGPRLPTKYVGTLTTNKTDFPTFWHAKSVNVSPELFKNFAYMFCMRVPLPTSGTGGLPRDLPPLLASRVPTIICDQSPMPREGAERTLTRTGCQRGVNGQIMHAISYNITNSSLPCVYIGFEVIRD